MGFPLLEVWDHEVSVCRNGRAVGDHGLDMGWLVSYGPPGSMTLADGFQLAQRLQNHSY